jgi:hypothetical protein
VCTNACIRISIDFSYMDMVQIQLKDVDIHVIFKRLFCLLVSSFKMLCTFLGTACFKTSDLILVNSSDRKDINFNKKKEDIQKTKLTV